MIYQGSTCQKFKNLNFEYLKYDVILDALDGFFLYGILLLIFLLIVLHHY